jgi:hypothetical protein
MLLLPQTIEHVIDELADVTIDHDSLEVRWLML